jgi:TetR/AcrR family transcriptional repressor of nem operon
MKFPRARDATKAETRDLLIAAGAAEFAEKGVEGPSLDAICARAGFTRGAFYVHFRDRDELLIAVLERVLVSFQETIFGAGDEPESLEQTIGRYIVTHLAGSPATHGSGRWHFHDTLAACSRIPALRKRYLALQMEAVRRVTEAARAGQRAKTVRNDVPPELLAQILVLVTLGLGAATEIGMPIDLALGGAALQTLLQVPKKTGARKTTAKKKKSAR